MHLQLAANTPYDLLDNDSLIRVYQSYVAIFKNISYSAGIMLNALGPHYAQNYAGISDWSLVHKLFNLNIMS